MFTFPTPAENEAVTQYRPWECPSRNPNEPPRLSAYFQILKDRREILQHFEYVENLIEDMDVVSRCVQCEGCGLYFVDQAPFKNHICDGRALQNERGTDFTPNPYGESAPLQSGGSLIGELESRRSKDLAKPRGRNFACTFCRKRYASEKWCEKHELNCCPKRKIEVEYPGPLFVAGSSVRAAATAACAPNCYHQELS